MQPARAATEELDQRIFHNGPYLTGDPGRVEDHDELVVGDGVLEQLRPGAAGPREAGEVASRRAEPHAT